MGYTLKCVLISKMEQVKMKHILKDGRNLTEYIKDARDLTEYINKRDKTNFTFEQFQGMYDDVRNQCLVLLYEHECEIDE